MTQKILKQIDTLTMPELLEFARMLANEPEQNDLLVLAGHRVHGRIQFLNLVRKVKCNAERRQMA